MGISKYIVIIVSLTFFLIPVSFADAIFSISIDFSGDEFVKNFEKNQKFNTEKFRDYYLEEYLRLQNPYNDNTSVHVITFNVQEFSMPISIDRDDENFQILKDKQVDLAQKKY